MDEGEKVFKMKKATEMCNIANNARNKKVKKQLESLEKEIIRRSIKGYFSMCCDCYKENISILQSYGYTVKELARDELWFYSHRISWNTQENSNDNQN